MSEGLPNATVIVEMWEADSAVNMFSLGSEIARIGNIYSKYLDIWLKYKVRRVKQQSALELIDKDATDWFTGKVPVNGKYYPFKLGAEELKTYKKSDQTVQKARENLEATEITIEVLTRIMDQLKQRSFDLRAVADIRKQENGG